MSSDAMRVSPQQVDPLSWISGRIVSLSFAAIVLVYGLATVIATWSVATLPLLDLLGVVLITAACVWVQLVTGPLHPPFGGIRAAVALALGVGGLAASSFALTASTIEPQFWWTPVALAVLVGTCAPHSSVRAIVIYGSILSAATAAATAAAYSMRDDHTIDVSTILITCSSVIVGTVAAAVFSFEVVRHSQRLLARAGVPLAPTEVERDGAAKQAEIDTLARLGSRVAPFLEKVADAGVVTAADRALAGQLARRLRSELVSQANRTWLDSLATSGRIFVVDPDRRADSMNAAQRAALRGLVLAVIQDPSTDSGSLLIELRGQDDGSTAVALSIDVDLPEGRRTMMLAPYLLALKTTVDDIAWDPAHVSLKFRLPPARNW